MPPSSATPPTSASADAVGALLAAQATAPERTLWSKVIGRSPLGDEARALYAAAETAHRTTRHLSQLPAGWMALTGFPVGTGDVVVDHVLVGPAGVFTVGTATGTTPRRPDDADQVRARTETTRLRTAWARGLDHDVPVQSIVVHDRVPASTDTDTGAIAIVDSALLPTLADQPAVLDEDHTRRLAEMVAGASVSTPAPAIDGEAFTRLRRDVAVARRVRVSWWVSGATALVAASAAAIILL